MEDTAIAALRDRLGRHPADRYPMQHALAQLHLGSRLFELGALEEAIEALATAAALFGERLPVEHATALNQLGAVLRQAGRDAQARGAFSRAAAVFETHQRPAERAAATFNLGLVAAGAGDHAGAAEAFATALAAFGELGQAASRGAASRELGRALLAMDRVPEALSAFTTGLADAGQTGDRMALGDALNGLGLAHLAAGTAEDAADAFRAAADAHPRGVRPDQHAMAKANLALALEALADLPGARIAARQAAAIEAAAGAVRAQAGAVLSRAGEPGPEGDLLNVLDGLERDAWPAMVRGEVTRWLELDRADRIGELRTFVSGAVARGGTAPELAEAFFGVVLEQPPDMTALLVDDVMAAVGALPDEAVELFRSATGRALPRFAMPQWFRLRGLLTEAAAASGVAGGWG